MMTVDHHNMQERNSYVYRVIQEESEILWEMIVCMILSKIVHITCVRFSTVTELRVFFISRTRPRVIRAYSIS
jgi:hypothetical protein